MENNIKEITVFDYESIKKLYKPHQLLDVRESWEQEICKLEDSINIPLGDLPQHIDTLPHDVSLIIMCHHGGRSAQATKWLQDNGFSNAINLVGGIDAWREQIDPSMKAY